ncbi:Ser/Thr protein kinase RdoA (MazF antagonist) [Bacillus sp. SORGH_AS 510]|uniref:phosphotransferase enzyme family protein n=1 Tax=Bacillus sp. SORGH_AS_0510 TaxID=3041771 RepID=UPI002781EEED|nr:phosphotransferase [Bacillus sp. SORGH_AS_0510]MDQ1145893.1 Ser/Thr protein kinase RdoA (MazF antagonist) [Bacillus sp. SORGH_AS_0510]
MSIHQIAARYDLAPEELIPITSGFQNSVYTYYKDGKEYILRVSNRNRKSLSALENELKFIAALEKEEVSVSRPVPSKYNLLIESVDHFFVVAFEKAQGVPVDVTDANVWNSDVFYNWGKQIGRMHKASQRIQLDRPKWTKEEPDLLDLLPKIESNLIKERYTELLDKLRDFQQDSHLFGLIHNDFHQGNFFVKDRRITIFDFDDCAYHWYAYDLAVSFYHAYWQASSFTPEQTDFSKNFWHHFLKGYYEEHTIDIEMLEQIPTFLKIREIFLYMLFLEKWDLDSLVDWQVYTLEDLKYRIEDQIPYSNVNFKELIDNFK